MDVQLDIQNAVDEDIEPPSTSLMHEWVRSALSDLELTSSLPTVEMTIRIVSEAEMQDLNERFRKKSGPTNVLSFPFTADIELETPLLGDLVICASVVEREARQQHKSSQAHWAHMIVHGTLHLLGYDHMTESEAQEMEAEEIRLLQQLGFSNPYEVSIFS